MQAFVSLVELPKALESREHHTAGREIQGCKIYEHMLLRTPLTDASHPDVRFPCLAP